MYARIETDAETRLGNHMKGKNIMYTFIALSVFVLLLSLSACQPGSTDVQTGGKTLVWSDEFDGPAGSPPNPADWGYEIGYIRNNELQSYTDRPENAHLDGNGNLVIKALKENYRGGDYTSASINTLGKHSWKYGRIEMRARLPYSRGIWPAFWGMGNEGAWPASGEIDIMEMIGGGPGYDNVVYGTAHWDDSGHKESGSSPFTLPAANFCDDYHIFAIEWNAQKITWYMDETAYKTLDISGEALSEFHQPFYLLLNLAVGGSWPGDPDETTVFPQEYSIDYVRIYQ